MLFRCGRTPSARDVRRWHSRRCRGARGTCPPRNISKDIAGNFYALTTSSTHARACRRPSHRGVHGGCPHGEQRSRRRSPFSRRQEERPKGHSAAAPITPPTLHRTTRRGPPPHIDLLGASRRASRPGRRSRSGRPPGRPEPRTSTPARRDGPSTIGPLGVRGACSPYRVGDPGLRGAWARPPGEAAGASRRAGRGDQAGNTRYARMVGIVAPHNPPDPRSPRASRLVPTRSLVPRASHS